MFSRGFIVLAAALVVLTPAAQAALVNTGSCLACMGTAGQFYCAGAVNPSACYNSAADQAASCSSVDGDGNRDRWVTNTEGCIPGGGGCASLGGDEGCQECSPWSTVCGWCFASESCMRYTGGTASAPTGMSCAADQFKAGSCLAPCPARSGCTICMQGGTCEWDPSGSQCYNSGSGPAGSFTASSQCPVSDNSGSKEALAGTLLGAAVCAAAF